MILRILLIALFLVQVPTNGFAWDNGPDDDELTRSPSQCSSPPYSTHDWVADHSLALLPDHEKTWLVPHKTLYLLGTEAPDNRKIPDECGAPNKGYDENGSEHSVKWEADGSGFAKKNNRYLDRAGKRAQEEYIKAEIAYGQGRFSDAAFFLGAMAHYLGDVSQYGHCVDYEGRNHNSYEGYVSTLTKSFNGGTFESYVAEDGLTRRSAYTAVRRISKVTALGNGEIPDAREMIRLYKEERGSRRHLDAIGKSLNLGVNELADVLHTFYLSVVQKNEQRKENL